MADTYKKISDFSTTSDFGDNDLLLVSQNGTTRVITGTLLKSFATAAGVEAAKINGAAVNVSGHLIMTTTDGTEFDAGQVVGENGISVTGAAIDENYHLILTFSDGSMKDAGYCRGASGAGTGDMQAEEYDPDNVVKTAGGIPKYVASQKLTGDYIPTSEKGNASGVATLGTDGKVPSSQLNLSSATNSSSTTQIANSAAIKTVNDKIPTLSDSVATSSSTTAASSAAVKTAYDKAAEAYNKADSGAAVTTYSTGTSMVSGSRSTCTIQKIVRIGDIVFVSGYAKLYEDATFKLTYAPTASIAVDVIRPLTDASDSGGILSFNSSNLNLAFTSPGGGNEFYFQFFYWV